MFETLKVGVKVPFFFFLSVVHMIFCHDGGQAARLLPSLHLTQDEGQVQAGLTVPVCQNSKSKIMSRP